MATVDNGTGIPQEIQECFEPFLTTKPVGKKTGMRIYISYQIVTERHQGKLEYFSNMGKGTEFVILIPVQ
ncbi:ATP-binding protein [Dapis sp. BLCC M126]|uniref:ATP-binding protein n=1 Tax=Dapis sp. BLCC M126 TaxID=3400189 RepID=UPI003CF2BF75